MAETPFDWLIGKYLEQAANELQGEIVKTINYPISVELTDKGFELTMRTMVELKNFAKSEGFELEHVAFISMTVAKLKRYGPPIVTTETSLNIIRDKNGRHTAILFDGCMIGENKQT